MLDEGGSSSWGRDWDKRKVNRLEELIIVSKCLVCFCGDVSGQHCSMKVSRSRVLITAQDFSNCFIITVGIIVTPSVSSQHNFAKCLISYA